MSELRFGDYLGQLLREQGCNGSRLASMLGIDPALVYRWLRNEAVPKLDTVYCDEIAQHLHLNQTALQQLKETQVYSLSKPMERRPKARSNSAAIESLLRQAAPGLDQAEASLLRCPCLIFRRPGKAESSGGAPRNWRPSSVCWMTCPRSHVSRAIPLCSLSRSGGCF